MLVRQEGGADRYFVSYSHPRSLVSTVTSEASPLHRIRPTRGGKARAREKSQASYVTHILNNNPQPTQPSINHLPIPLEVLHLLWFVVGMAIGVVLCGLGVLFLDVAEVREDFVVGEDGGLGFDDLREGRGVSV